MPVSNIYWPYLSIDFVNSMDFVSCSTSGSSGAEPNRIYIYIYVGITLSDYILCTTGTFHAVPIKCERVLSTPVTKHKLICYYWPVIHLPILLRLNCKWIGFNSKTVCKKHSRISYRDHHSQHVQYQVNPNLLASSSSRWQHSTGEHAIFHIIRAVDHVLHL